MISDTQQSPIIELGDGPLGPDATVDRDVLVTMTDGTRIACDVYRPSAPGPYPVLFAISPYIKDAVYLPSIAVYRYRECGNIARWVDRGYVFVHTDIRGTGKSEGLFRPFSDEEQRDLFEMIEWCGTQPWSNGKVGMIGESYYAMVQWAAAAQRPPHLACIAPYDGCNDLYRHFCYKGGVFFGGYQAHWYSNSVRNREYLDYAERPKPADIVAYDWLLEQVKHPTFDHFWEGRRINLQSINTPVFSIGNWAGTRLHLNGNIRGFLETRGPKKLLINSGDTQKLFTSPYIEEQLLRWYDHWLRGTDTGIMDEPPIRIFVRNGRGYRDEAEWPLKRAQMHKLYLGPGPSRATESINDGTLDWDPPSEDLAPSSYTYPDSAWTFPGLNSAVPGKYGLPHLTRKIVTFTSAPMEGDVEVTGPIVFKLWASSTGEDTQFIVKIMDVESFPPDVIQAIETLDISPPSQMVTEGWLKASHRHLDPEQSSEFSPYHDHVVSQPLQPGEIYEYAIEIWPTSWVFKAGHRIRLDITALDQQGLYYLGQLRSTDSFYHDPAHPSHLLLPVIP
jgi:putative CocE/NonD family hydrolase